jgi:hypothetical protein
VSACIIAWSAVPVSDISISIDSNHTLFIVTIEIQLLLLSRALFSMSPLKLSLPTLAAGQASLPWGPNNAFKRFQEAGMVWQTESFSASTSEFYMRFGLVCHDKLEMLKKFGHEGSCCWGMSYLPPRRFLEAAGLELREM